MDGLIRVIFMLLCWFGTGIVAGVIYEEGLDAALIVVGSISVFLSLSTTAYCFIPNTVHRFVFGGSDRKFW